MNCALIVLAGVLPAVVYTGTLQKAKVVVMYSAALYDEEINRKFIKAELLL